MTTRYHVREIKGQTPEIIETATGLVVAKIFDEEFLALVSASASIERRCDRLPPRDTPYVDQNRTDDAMFRTLVGAAQAVATRPGKVVTVGNSKSKRRKLYR